MEGGQSQTAMSKEEGTRKCSGKEQGAVRNSRSRERWGPGGNRGVREDLEEVTQDMTGRVEHACSAQGLGRGGGQGWALRNLVCLEHGMCE